MPKVEEDQTMASQQTDAVNDCIEFCFSITEQTPEGEAVRLASKAYLLWLKSKPPMEFGEWISKNCEEYQKRVVRGCKYHVNHKVTDELKRRHWQEECTNVVRALFSLAAGLSTVTQGSFIKFFRASTVNQTPSMLKNENAQFEAK